MRRQFHSGRVRRGVPAVRDLVGPEFDVDLAFIASGPNGGDVEWTRRLMTALAERGSLDRMWGLSMHHYCSAPDAGADAVAFDERGWYDLLTSADRMESIVGSIWEVMRQIDRAASHQAGRR